MVDTVLSSDFFQSGEDSMSKYFLLLLILSNSCLSSEHGGDVVIETYSPTVHHKSHNMNYDNKDHTDSSSSINRNKKQENVILELENKAITSAKLKGISSSIIETAINQRRNIIESREDLRDKEFHITLKGNIVFHNGL